MEINTVHFIQVSSCLLQEMGFDVVVVRLETMGIQVSTTALH